MLKPNLPSHVWRTNANAPLPVANKSDVGTEYFLPNILSGEFDLSPTADKEPSHF
jgi:hypothetical protein